MAAKKGLGKGLDSLIPSKPIESAKEVSDQNAVENAKAMVSIEQDRAKCRAATKSI